MLSVIQVLKYQQYKIKSLKLIQVLYYANIEENICRFTVPLDSNCFTSSWHEKEQSLICQLLSYKLGNKLLITCNGDETQRKSNSDWINHFVYTSTHYIFNVFCDKKKILSKELFCSSFHCNSGQSLHGRFSRNRQ